MFLQKTFDIVSTPDLDNEICWTKDGKGFIVSKTNEFAERVLPKYFKHNNFSSFVRQLNMYDFHKSRASNNEQIFSHPSFQRGKKELLKNIKRKTTT